ncbi:nuclear transport factor 2 family protein [Bifidobacterium tsurumiense]|uniref:Rhs element Vgr protein family protein n=1 Tax=Bifidobacterium tsurumiense TaxID=356829 RepID=A0A087EK43_9BIFI|nr:nuclear transport factor 2 family protein [Bifidobacterium tsurumiense]KFJ08144.1 Rhs element Vgr protein family protein [Bifidobacterium tsurumiense]MDY4678707.1 nuclear transport factor 2 family protein [Bifidobacterium tsurumiense]MSS13086.1 nuclear transport factor 2 family protein [Bifidobacterium tsurumiense]
MPVSKEITKSILDINDVLIRGMLHADVGVLKSILAPNYSLVHMTGYGQSGQEWLNQLADGRMRYDKVDVVSVEVEGDGEHPILRMRSRTTANIWGSQGTWNLDLRSTFRRQGDGWVFAHTDASTW